MTLEEFNALPPEELRKQLYSCCSSVNWAEKMATLIPYTSPDHLLNMAERCWHKCKEGDWLDAFNGHPRLGDIESLKKKFRSTADIAKNEQSGAAGASPEVLEELALGNKAYEKKFGFIYILFATGKTAKVMLSILRIRLNNDLQTEKIMAMVEQNKITKLRLEKLLV
ncbi:MAG: 2-oxo-4-hydroxy-4-carboxy-5-ureidoimidazoline decarboxylase [Flavobacteriales bacterium]|nr:2-oxo-4-hydroxy-4-carboxy-5-ureidoimidazoline decarboxylase [Flavobacteriales bacterium]